MINCKNVKQKIEPKKKPSQREKERLELKKFESNQTEKYH